MSVVRLIGQDIGYSASPVMQMAAFRALDLPHDYLLMDISATDLPRTVGALRESDSLGANVTRPHKAAVAGSMDELDPVARELGAVNTVVRREDQLVGYNTDLPALIDAISDLRASACHAVVLGAGGASRAVVRALTESGAQWITVVARRAARAAITWDRLPAILPHADLLVNATPVGTDPEDTPLPQELLHGGLAVLDLVYRPSPTRLVREARAAGAPAAAGAGVLLGQGWRSLEAWLDIGAPVEAMRAALRAELGEGADV